MMMRIRTINGVVKYDSEKKSKILSEGGVFMLAFIPILIIGGFLGGCAVVIAASCVQLAKVTVNLPKNDGRMPRAIEA